jgi:superfamily II DNA or RNA helicase
MEMEIQTKFSFEVPNAKHDPRVKKGHWDGYKRLYNRRDKTFPIGLVLALLRFIKGQGYSYSVDPELIPSSDLTREDLEHVIKEVIDPHSKGKPITPHEHQYDALMHMFSMGRSLCLSSTSSGKSLIIYCALRILQLLPEMEGKRMFVVVPSGNLVEQMYGDFEDYANGSCVEWNVAGHCQKVNKDYKKFIDKQIVITTWQSMSKLPKKALDEMNVMFCDEVHGAKADVLSSMITNSINCPMKHGLTGTLDGFESNEMFIEGMFGPRKIIMTAKESIDKGVATAVNIKMILLKYEQEFKDELESKVFLKEDGTKRNPKDWYGIEKEYVYSLEERRKFIVNLALSLEGNTLILFDSIDSYQTPVYEMLKEKSENVFVINGEVSNKERDVIKSIIEAGDRIITCATYGTMAVGISINKLDNMILASSTKAMIRIIQSIGRLMRLHESKDMANIYDIVDDMSIPKKGYSGYMIQHGQKRVKIYADEKHPVKFYPIPIKKAV